MLTLERALELVKHSGYGDVGAPSGAKGIVDEAAVRLLQMHPWNVTLCPPRHVGVRAAIDITGATWTAATRSLESTGSFEDYDFAPGDSISILDGTEAKLRDYTVQERVDDDEILLTEDIGATDGSTDIDATLNANRAVILPSDFGWGLRYYALTGGQGLVELRNSGASIPGGFSGSLWQAHNVSTAGGSPAWRLELYPYPTEEDPQLLTVSYHVAWSRPSTDTGILPIPAILEPLFISILRQLTAAYEQEDEGTIEDRMDRIMGSSTFVNAIEADGLAQSDYGEMQGGAEGAEAVLWGPLYPSGGVADPA